MDVEYAELRTGLSRTGQYLLSHHEEGELHRCHSVGVFGRRVHLCARCSGIYPGIALGLYAYLTASGDLTSLLLVAVLPLPAMLDWAVTTFTDWRGSNFIRTTTGALLGYGYGSGLGALFLARNLAVVPIGVVYALLAGVLLYFDVGR